MLGYTAVDLFCGCGGMTEGLKQSGFHVIAGVEIDENAGQTYLMNHAQEGTVLFRKDIRKVAPKEICNLLSGRPLHLLAGCPPCQGFSSIRRKNKKGAVDDPRNQLIHEYYRFVEELRPVTIMLENVPALCEFEDFKQVVQKIEALGYIVDYRVVDVAKYGVPQRRKRLVLLGSLLGKVYIAQGSDEKVTVRNRIGWIEDVYVTKDPIHQIYPHHTASVQKRIEMTPLDGGSRNDLPEDFTLNCHKKEGVGFRDVYGRLRWDDVSSTITGGCLNPSKGRFLHPKENRCITAREAALLQTFPKDYHFPVHIPIGALALMIGNALPPEFCKQQAKCICKHLDVYFMPDVFDKAKRSEIMSAVKNKGTKQEILVRDLLCRLGFNKYRLNTPQLKCSPDIVFVGLKKAIFVNGCFWHGHDCSRGTLPSSNIDFWKNKINTNKERDLHNYAELESKGWDYLVIWQCEISKKNMALLEEKVRMFMIT